MDFKILINNEPLSHVTAFDVHIKWNRLHGHQIELTIAGHDAALNASIGEVATIRLEDEQGVVFERQFICGGVRKVPLTLSVDGWETDWDEVHAVGKSWRGE